MGAHDVYTLNQTPHSTRFGTTYNYSHHDTGPCSESRRATITNWLGRTVKLHSLSPAFSPLHVCSPNQLLATLASWENQPLWKHLKIDGSAGDWIFSRLMRASLVIGHDGSYMPHLANNVVACAIVFYCSHTNQYVDVTWVERSTKKAANNYCAKILGACSTQLIIEAAITGHNVLGHGPLTVRCNNMEVVQHGNSLRSPMLERQPQSDVYGTSKALWLCPELVDRCNMCTAIQTSTCQRLRCPQHSK